MKNENNLVREMSACETMGGANNICTDKTGTLTQNSMTVSSIYFEEQTYTSIQSLTQNKNISQENLKLLCEGICFNSNASPKLQPNGTFEQVLFDYSFMYVNPFVK